MVDFYKYHGLGNDYLVLDPAFCQWELNKERVRLLCHRNYGIGADGILHGPLASDDGWFFRIYNPDGSEAEKSGNGIRIFAQYLLDRGYVTGDEMKLVTIAGAVSVQVIDAAKHILKVEMGGYSFDSEKIPVAGNQRKVIAEPFSVAERNFSLTAVTVGNPHAVIHLDDISAAMIRQYGPDIENNQLFPQRINVQFVKVLDRHRIQIEIWERGAGYTLASGTSSCAAALASIERGFVDSPVTVVMPGGEVVIEQDGQLVFLTGAVAGSFSGSCHADLTEQIQRL